MDVLVVTYLDGDSVRYWRVRSPFECYMLLQFECDALDLSRTSKLANDLRAARTCINSPNDTGSDSHWNNVGWSLVADTLRQVNKSATQLNVFTGGHLPRQRESALLESSRPF